MNLLGAKLYDPAGAVSKACTSLIAMTALDTSNLRIAITVPAHGMVRFVLRGTVTGATTQPMILLGVLNGATVLGRMTATWMPGTGSAATNQDPIQAEFTVTGLTPGAMNVDAAYGVQVVVASTNIKYGGPNDTNGNDAWGGFLFEAWDPQPLPVAIAPGASGGLLISGTNAGTTTLGAFTVTGASTFTGAVSLGSTLGITGAATLSAGVTVNQSTANTPAVTIAGNGSGAGVQITGGAAVTTTAAGPGVKITGGASSTSSGGVAGQAVIATGGAGSASTNGAAEAVKYIGGGTNTVASAAHALLLAGTSTGSGISATSGAGATGNGITATAASTNGNGIAATGNGTGDGITGTGGASAGGDGISGVAGGGVDLRANITGNLTGTVATLTTYTGNTPQTGDAYARLGAPAGASVSADVAAAKVDTAAIKVKTDFLPSATAGAAGGVQIAGSNAATTYASLTSTAAFTVNGVSAVSQTGDAYARLGAPAGASVSADVAAVKVDTAAVKVKTDFLPSATAGAAGGVFIAGTNAATTASITGNITGNVSGSVGSVTGAVGSVTGAVGSVTGNVGGSVASVTGAVGSVTGNVGGSVASVVGLTASNLDAAVSTRLASGSYTAPPSAATNATAVRTELATELARVDVATSTRLASAGYTAPDNTGIAAVQAKTDNLPSAPASTSDVTTVGTAVAAVKTVVDAVQVKTDQLAFTAGHVDANITAVNDIAVTGSGTSADPWGP